MIKAKITGQKIETYFDTVASESKNYLKVNFSFSGDWDGYAKTAVFKSADKAKSIGVVLESDECTVPYEIIYESGFSLSVYGIKGNSRITTTESYIWVQKSGFTENTTEPASPSQTEYEQIISIMQENKQTSENLRKDAEDGKFKGEKGDKGDTGAQGIQGIKGEKGDTGEKGDKGDKGDRGEKGEKGDAFVYTDFTSEQLAQLKGEKGDKGEQGIQGIKGDKGDTGEKGEKGDKGDLTELQMHTACSNPLKGYATGNPITITDASPNEHELKVTVKSKNLIPYPYCETTKTVNGITFTDNGDGTITANGTATERATFKLQTFTNVNLEKGEYFISGCHTGGNINSYRINFATRMENKTFFDKSDIGNGLLLDTENKISSVYGVIIIAEGTTCSDLIFKPMLCRGKTSIPYKKYFSDKTKAIVKRSGKNLLPFPYADVSQTINGITFNVNNDGSVTVTGTPTADTSFCLQENAYYGNEDIESKTNAPSSNMDYSASKRISYNSVTKKAELVFKQNDGFSGSEIFYPQIEYGKISTDYEPYITPEFFTPSADGTVKNLLSMKQTMNISCEKSEIDIDIEYNKDLNKAFCELQALILDSQN